MKFPCAGVELYKESQELKSQAKYIKKKKELNSVYSVS